MNNRAWHNEYCNGTRNHLLWENYNNFSTFRLAETPTPIIEYNENDNTNML